MQLLLQKRKIFTVNLPIEDIKDETLTGIPFFPDGCQAIILDRISINKNILSWAVKLPCFVIYERPEEFAEFDPGARLAGDSQIRFYFWPLNISLLADDILSIVASKKYHHDEKILIDKLEINYLNRSISNGNKVLFMKNKEFDLLFYLAKHRGRVMSRSIILEQVWDMNSRVLTNTVDVHVSKVRRIISQTFGINSLIKTIPCSGYLIP